MGLSGFEIQQCEGPLTGKGPQRPVGTLKGRQNMDDLGSGTDPGPINCGLNGRNSVSFARVTWLTLGLRFPQMGLLEMEGIQEFHRFHSSTYWISSDPTVDHYGMHHYDFFQKGILNVLRFQKF